MWVIQQTFNLLQCAPDIPSNLAMGIIHYQVTYLNACMSNIGRLLMFIDKKRKSTQLIE